MSITFVRATLDITLDPGRHNSIRTRDGDPLQVYLASAFEVRATLIRRTTDQLYDIQNITAPQLWVFKSDGTTLIGPIALSDSNPTLDSAGYAAGGYHLRWKVSSAQASAAGLAGEHNLAIRCGTSDDPTDEDRIIYAPITFVASGPTNPSGTLPVPAEYPPYEVLMARFAAIAEKAAYQLVAEKGIPDNLENPTKRRYLGVNPDGTKFDEVS